MVGNGSRHVRVGQSQPAADEAPEDGCVASLIVGRALNRVLHDQAKMFKVTGDKTTWKRFKVRTDQKVNRQVKGL